VICTNVLIDAIGRTLNQEAGRRRAGSGAIVLGLLVNLPAQSGTRKSG